MQDHVICQICGWKGRQINITHLRHHNIKAKQYKEMFPNAELTCEATKELLRAKAKGKPCSEEQKKKISESMKKVYHETDFPLKKIHKSGKFKGEGNPFYGKTHTEEFKQKLSELTSERLKKAYESGEIKSPFRNLGNGKQMSSYEIEVYRLLKPLGFEYDYPISFKKGRYLIDFAHLPKRIAIEIDSKLHDTKNKKESDERKDQYLKAIGWDVHRMRMSMKEHPIDFAEKVLVKAKTLLGENKYETNKNK